MQTINSWTRENNTGNNFLGNACQPELQRRLGGTELNQTSQVYDLAFRNYDPVLGRPALAKAGMSQVDPMAGKYSSLTPYNFSFNDPVSFTDPSGADPYGNDAIYYAYNFDRVSPGMAPLEIMDPIIIGGTIYHNSWIWNPATAGGYGVAGYMGSVIDIVESYAPDFRGWVYLGQDYNGNAIAAMPTDIARAGGAQAYFNIAYNLSLGMNAFNLAGVLMGNAKGISVSIPVVGGRLDLENPDIIYYRTSEYFADLNVQGCLNCPVQSNYIAGLSPGFTVNPGSGYKDISDPKNYPGINIYEHPNMKGGITLPGIGIIVGPGSTGRYRTRLLQHEYGHFLDYKFSGDLNYNPNSPSSKFNFYVMIGIPSLFSAAMDIWGIRGHDHTNSWTEVRANDWAQVWFGNRLDPAFEYYYPTSKSGK